MSRAWVFWDNVDTDAIIPARYLTTYDEALLAAHAMEDLDPSFATEVREKDVVVAGTNFGCGSSREHAPLALKAAGVSAVVATSFARIFYRNAINVGLPIVVCPEASGRIAAGAEVEVDPTAGTVRLVDEDTTFVGEQLPDFVMDIVRAGGLVGWVKERA